MREDEKTRSAKEASGEDHFVKGSHGSRGEVWKGVPAILSIVLHTEREIKREERLASSDVRPIPD